MAFQPRHKPNATSPESATHHTCCDLYAQAHSAELHQRQDATALDGELTVWDARRPAFELLQNRLHWRGAGAIRAAAQWPTPFDVLRLAGTDITSWPYRRRREPE
ncbi:hypothetical protein ABZU45_34580 [Streptomyces avermitilis]|uniref:hypothetical protein n=1 Tax=Streptomyces avermitilis TaxID=33903 RepID=UPI0033B47080